MQTDGWGKVELELAGFDQAVEVGKVDEFFVYVVAFYFGGAFGEPTINPGVNCGEDAGDEGGIFCTLVFVGGDIGGNFWLLGVNAYGEQGVISKNKALAEAILWRFFHYVLYPLWDRDGLVE